MNLGRHFRIKKSACRNLQCEPHHFGGNIQFCSGVPLRPKGVGDFYDLRGVALDTAPVKGGSGNAPSPVVRFSVRRNHPLAKQNLHALLRPVLAEEGSLVDQHFGNISGIVQQHNVTRQDAIVRGAAITLQILEQENRVGRIKEAVKPVERQIEAQARRIDVSSTPHHLRRFALARRRRDGQMGAHDSSLRQPQVPPADCPGLQPGALRCPQNQLSVLNDRVHTPYNGLWNRKTLTHA